MSTELPTIYLARHGETAWSLAGQHTGLTDLTLTAPLQRARRTCELAGFGATAELDRDLLEWNYCQYKGRRTAEIQAERPGWQLFRDGCPVGESRADVATRADRVLSLLRTARGDGLLFSSGHFLRALAARWRSSNRPAAGSLCRAQQA